MTSSLIWSGDDGLTQTRSHQSEDSEDEDFSANGNLIFLNKRSKFEVERLLIIEIESMKMMMRRVEG